jgi:endonuclease I
LDRIDNIIGHIKSNVVVACLRCNSIRSNMPYEAWLSVVPAIKTTKQNGLFKGWKNWREAQP